ncbi:polysaccharide deacetylase family protein [Flavobacterium sp. 83]|uniref:polysaccharide deacetylase family protein n=1 Tax=Flavobacterium sp. 83 TaxID=1131812 RepID=UPI00068E58DE|nr:polysaccharide deacetylase family protein [Flavobacterium sp. 83]
MQSNKNNKIFKFILLCTFFLFSCENKTTSQKSNAKEINPGVVISFDDTSINEWYQADKILSKYSWKATFCVSKINTLSHSEIKELKQLQKEGHEIAGHGFHHFNAPKFVAKNGVDAYINQEINPMLTLMHFYNFKVTSFAYPFGFRNTNIDKALFKKFKIIRGTTYGAEDPFFQNCYFNNSRLVYGIGIDTDHPNFSIPYLLKLLDYAERKHKILVLFGHKPVQNITANYQTKMETLQLICSYVKQHNMTFYTLSELNNIK